MKIYVAGHAGLVGSSIVRRIQEEGEHEWVGRTRGELDLLTSSEVSRFFAVERPDAVVVAAARVGGIGANADYPVEFLSENLQIQINLLTAAFEAGVQNLIFLGSSCIYPKFAPQPLKEEYLLTGALEPTNEAYALAKIAGLKMVEGFRSQYHRKWISLMPCNLYGPGDNFDLETGHVLPSIMRRIYEAKITGAESVSLWGDGTAIREFMHVDDLARAITMILGANTGESLMNVGSGEEVSIRSLSNLIAKTLGYTGEILWDTSKPNGTPRKLLDSSKIKSLGWSSAIDLSAGIRSTFEYFLSQSEK